MIGVGWVGLCTAACFAELGHDVVARDILPDKVESLSRGEVPIHEPGLPELVAKNADRLHFTTDMGEVLERARLLFCCVDTPPTYSGDADLSRVEAVVDELGDSNEHAIVMKSTVPVGTGRSIQRTRERPRLRVEPRVPQGGLGGRGLHEPRPRGGRAPTSHSDGFADRVAALYEPLGGPIVRTDVASAEMIKLASNAFLATKISFINEIANVSEELGADVNEVARGMGLDDADRRQVPARRASAIGGSCFPKDVTALKQLAGNSGYAFQLLTAVIEVNELQKRRTVGKLQKHLGSLVGKEIALLGVAFKPDTDDIREATSLVLAARLQGEGANVRVYDPVAAERRPARCWAARASAPAPLEALDGADAAVLVTEWPEFAELDWAGEVKQRMAHADRGRRAQLPRPRGAARGGLHLRRHRALGRDAGARPRGRRGHAAAAAHPHHAQAGHAARRPAVPDVHARLARVPRRRRGDPVVRLHVRRRARRARRHLRRHAAALRGRGRAAGHRRAGAPGATTRGCSTSALFVLNGDVLTDMDLTAQLAQHEATGARPRWR